MRFPFNLSTVALLLPLALPAAPPASLAAEERGAASPRTDRPDPGTRADLMVPRDAPTIQAAIEAVPDGGSIFVQPGVYRETLTIVGKHVRLSGRQASLVGESSGVVDDADRAVGLVNYLEGAGGVFEGFELHGGLNGIVGQPPSDPRGGEEPVPAPRAHALTVRDVEIRNTGRGILWRAAADLAVHDTRIQDARRHGIVARPKPGSGAFVKVFNVFVEDVGSFGVVVIDTPSIGCQNQLVNVNVALGQDGGIGVFRSGVCIFGGHLSFNHKAGIRFEESAAVVDGTTILATLDTPLPDQPDVVIGGTGILAYLSDLQQIVNAFIGSNGSYGIALFGSTAVLGWDTLNCNPIDLVADDLPANGLGPGVPSATVTSNFDPLFPPIGGCWCGCGEVSEGCQVAGSGAPQPPGPVGGLE